MNVLNYQLFKILTTRDSISELELASELKLSNKTLQKYIEELDGELSEIADIKHKNKKYYLSVRDYPKLAKFQTYYLKTTLDFNNPAKRQAYILYILTKKQDYVLLDDLSEALMVSKGTINRDIKELRNSLEKYGVLIKSVSNNGILLTSEADYQIAFVLRNFVCDYYDLGEKIPLETKRQINQVVRHYERSKTANNLLIRHVKILRFLRQINRRITTVPYEYSELMDTASKQEILKNLAPFLPSDLTNAERIFLLIPLNINYNNWSTEKMVTRLNWLDEVFETIFKQVAHNITISLNYQRLYEQIKYHALFMINRAATYFEGEDFFSKEIVEKYPVAVDLAIMTVNLLEQKLNLTISDSELSYLALYYQMELEDEAQGKSKIHKVAIVGDVSRSVKNLIINRLNETFQGTTEADLYKDADSFQQAAKRYLIVFSTLPLANDKHTTPIVRLQSIFKNDELISKVTLSQIIAGIEEKQVKLRIKRFEYKVDYLTAVETLIDEEIKLKELLPSFKTAWQKREKKMSNVFQHGIAIPHMVDESGHSRILLTIGILTKPVKYQGKEVSLIFLIGIPKNLDAKLSKILTQAYDFIFMISGNEDIYSNLLNYDPTLELTQITEGI